jgi:hypothetical protein
MGHAGVRHRPGSFVIEMACSFARHSFLVMV